MYNHICSSLYDQQIPYNVNFDIILTENGPSVSEFLNTDFTRLLSPNIQIYQTSVINFGKASSFISEINDIYGIRISNYQIGPYLAFQNSNRYEIGIKTAYKKLGLTSNNYGVAKAFFNSFELEWDWSFFSWGERNNAGEIPINFKFYLAIISNLDNYLSGSGTKILYYSSYLI